MLQLYSDISVNNGVHAFAEQMVNAGHTVYLYNFQYHPQTFGAIGWAFPFIGIYFSLIFFCLIFFFANFDSTNNEIMFFAYIIKTPLH